MAVAREEGRVAGDKNKVTPSLRRTTRFFAGTGQFSFSKTTPLIYTLARAAIRRRTRI
jgi:hypothetical protein